MHCESLMAARNASRHYAPMHGRRKRDRPHLQYWKYVEQLTGLGSTEEIFGAAQDRIGWRELVVDCTSGVVVS